MVVAISNNGEMTAGPILKNLGYPAYDDLRDIVNRLNSVGVPYAPRLEFEEVILREYYGRNTWECEKTSDGNILIAEGDESFKKYCPKYPEFIGKKYIDRLNEQMN